MNDNTADEPTWLDTEYLTKILSKYTKNQLKEIKSFTKAPATQKGENYASSIHLVTARYTIETEPEIEKCVSFIVKSRLENELMSQIEEDFDVFHREAQIYKVIMDAMENVLSSVGDNTHFGPRAIFVDEQVIVQENLKEQDFFIADVKFGLDFEQCRIVLEKLAKFHATSMVLYKKNPDTFRHHLPSNVSEHPTPLHDLYINTMKTAIEYCKSSKNLNQYVRKLEAFGEKVIPKMINVFSRSQMDRYHVLNHGDVWVNNIMFHKNSNGKFDDLLFVDYQEGFYGSPGIDINYFIFTSWKKEVFQHHFDELLAVYHTVLSEMLQKLKYEQRIPTLEDVKKAVINKGFHGLVTAMCLMPILINEHPDLASPLNFLMDSDEAVECRRKIFFNPRYGERLELYLAYFEENEIL